MTRSFLDSSIEMEFLKDPIFLIRPTPLKYDMQQMWILKVISENVAKVQKLYVVRL